MVRGEGERSHEGISPVHRHEHTKSSWMMWDYFKGGRHKMRRPWHSPIVRRFLQIWRESRIGSTSRHISDRTHMQCYYFSEYLAYKLSIYRVQRQIGLFGVTFGAAFFGYILAGLGANWFTAGYAQGNYQPDDFSRGVMSFYGGDDKKRYLIQHSL